MLNHLKSVSFITALQQLQPLHIDSAACVYVQLHSKIWEDLGAHSGLYLRLLLGFDGE